MNSKKYFLLAALPVTFLLISWGVIAHRSIGKIAENHLSKKAKKAVYDLLGTETMPLVSTYADEVRSYNEYKYTAPWHYVNPPKGLNYEDFTKYLKDTKEPNVYNALLLMEKDLKDPSKSKADKLFALKFIIHLIGDLHQPMHTGREEDLGGNKVIVKFRGRETNLHGLWDSGLVEYNGYSFTEMATAFDNVSKTEIKQWQKDDVTKWIYESYEISQQLYLEAEKNPDFDFMYYPNHAEIYKKRVQQAGVRLAGFLNRVYL